MRRRGPTVVRLGHQGTPPKGVGNERQQVKCGTATMPAGTRQTAPVSGRLLDDDIPRKMPAIQSSGACGYGNRHEDIRYSEPANCVESLPRTRRETELFPGLVAEYMS
jgi:hypothetical protein